MPALVLRSRVPHRPYFLEESLLREGESVMEMSCRCHVAVVQYNPGSYVTSCAWHC